MNEVEFDEVKHAKDILEEKKKLRKETFLREMKELVKKYRVKLVPVTLIRDGKIIQEIQVSTLD